MKVPRSPARSMGSPPPFALALAVVMGAALLATATVSAAQPLPFNQAAVKANTATSGFGPDASKPHFTVRFAMPITPDNDYSNRGGAMVGIDEEVADYNQSPNPFSPPSGPATDSFNGPHRKSKFLADIKPGETVTLCDIKGPGTIRHIWMTMKPDPETLRSCVVRVWWDGQKHPSIECPVGDFMGFAHGKVIPYRFWYEPIPSAPLPAVPDVNARTKDIWTQPSSPLPAGQ